MPSIYSSDPDLLVHYGPTLDPRLERFRRVVLQPGRATRQRLASLSVAGTTPYAYLSLGEDPGPTAPWHRPRRNAWWGGAYVRADHPGWRRTVLEGAWRSVHAGFGGVFLDTLDVPTLFPEELEPMLRLVQDLRMLLGDRPILANRGLHACAALAPWVDGFVFEGFSTTWVSGYTALTTRQLLEHADLLRTVQATGLPVYALDYADRPELARFARARARTHGLPSQVADRDLTCLPDRA